MRSSGNDFNYFKLTKLANFVQFDLFCLEDWGGLGPLPLGYATEYGRLKILLFSSAKPNRCRSYLCTTYLYLFSCGFAGQEL